MEFDRPFTHLCVFSFSGRGKQTEREQGERERVREKGGREVWWKRTVVGGGGEVTKAHK